MPDIKLEDRINEIIRQPVRVLNAMVGKGYEAKLDFDKLNWQDIREYGFTGLEEIGLQFDEASRQITGIPKTSGDLDVTFRFKIEGQAADALFTEKKIKLIVNPDPRSLWKNIESDRDDPHFKEDQVSFFSSLADRHVVACSKRGRSHANNGSFREDDFSIKKLSNGWSILSVADGAGSASLSRKGSSIACSTVIQYFTDATNIERLLEFDTLFKLHNENGTRESQTKLNHFVYNHLGNAALSVHKKLQEFAAGTSVQLKDLSTTLIFTLFKKYQEGYAFLTFGVGDCPVAILDKGISEVTLLNRMDVGEYGGGTRFITMPEIFHSETFATRFSLKIVPDFSYFFMMSDGIYDPKFVVEANLGNIKKWQTLIADLGGRNDEGTSVRLDASNKDIEQQLCDWMDFWSAGNHDDRTLIILF